MWRTTVVDATDSLSKGSNAHNDFGRAEECSCLAWKADDEILLLAMLSASSEPSKPRKFSSQSSAAKNLELSL